MCTFRILHNTRILYTHNLDLFDIRDILFIIIIIDSIIDYMI